MEVCCLGQKVFCPRLYRIAPHFVLSQSSRYISVKQEVSYAGTGLSGGYVPNPHFKTKAMRRLDEKRRTSQADHGS